MVKRLVLSLFGVFLLAFASVSVQAGTGLRDDRDTALKTGADTHAERQGAYAIGSASLCWNTSGTAPHASWEWVIGSGTTYGNVQGISAMGLLAAYEVFGDSAYLNGALAAGDELIACYDSISDRPYSQDVQFLAWLANLSGDDHYAAKAAAYYGRVISEFTATENADRYINNRKSLAPWDLASQIRAAIAVGENDYAEGMMAQIIARRGDWEHVPYGSYDYTSISYAALPWALDNLKQKEFRAFRDEITDLVLAAQGSDGSWDGDQQETAYSLLGLSTVPKRPQVQAAVAGGVGFLVLIQDTGGGWPYEDPGGGTTEYGEVNSEVLMGLGASNVNNGLHSGFSDPQPDHGADQHKVEPEP